MASTLASTHYSAWNDLAVTYLARYRSTANPIDILAALDATRLARDLAPSSASVQFNLALALTQFGLIHQAGKAWRRYLELDPASSWSQEARRHLSLLSKPSLLRRWEAETRKLENSGGLPSDDEMRRIVDIFPYRSRTWGEEELLRKWADSQLGGRHQLAASTLQWLRPLARALAEKHHSHMLLDCVAAIDSAIAQNQTEKISALARGHRAYSQAILPYSNQNLKAAVPLFATAHRSLVQGNSPLAMWAEFYLAMAAYYRDTSRGGGELKNLGGRVDAIRYPDLAGRVNWMLATVAVVREQPEQAVSYARLAFDQIDGSLGETGSGFLNTVLAEALARLGEADLSWKNRMATFASVPYWGDHRRFHSALVETVQMLGNQSRMELTPPFLNELVDNAEEWGNPTAISESYLQRGRIALDLDKVDEASIDLQTSEAALSRMPEGEIRDLLSYRLEAEKARLLLKARPGPALAQLSTAMALQSAVGNSFDELRLLTAQAKALMEIQEWVRAEQALRQAIGIYEDIRKGIVDQQFRISAFNQAQPAFEAYVDLLLQTHASAERSFTIAEQARSRYLLDLRQSAAAPVSEVPSEPISLFELRRLAPGTGVLMYMILKKRLVLWFAHRKGIEIRTVEIAEKELEQQVARMRNAIQYGMGSKESERRAEILSRSLIAPFGRELAAIDRLTIVPDRFLQRVPFNALPNPIMGRLLVENYPISLVPSVRLMLSSKPPKSFAGKEAKALIVGNPKFDQQKFGPLADLQGAAEEAGLIAGLYKNSLLLEGAAATESAVLTNVPKFDIFHFAGHAQSMPSSIRLSRLLLAPDPGSTDGALHALELTKSFEATRLVVLAACGTLDSVSTDREDFFGLGSAFLAAGVQSVVASLWDVSDSRVGSLMVDFHKHVAVGHTGAEALRLAILRARKDKRNDVWSAFEVIEVQPALIHSDLAEDVEVAAHPEPPGEVSGDLK